MVALAGSKCPKCLVWRFLAAAAEPCPCEVDLQSKCFFCCGVGMLHENPGAINFSKEPGNFRCQVCDGRGLLSCIPGEGS